MFSRFIQQFSTRLILPNHLYSCAIWLKNEKMSHSVAAPPAKPADVEQGKVDAGLENEGSELHELKEVRSQ